MTSREEFLKRLRATFKIEATEGIDNITSNLIELEKGQEETRKTKIVETVFREAHSLKGAARAVNFSEIEAICQALENVFSALKKNLIPLSSGLFDLFHLTVNLLSELLDQSESGKNSNAGEKINDVIKKLELAETGKVGNNEQINEPAQKTVAEPKEEPEAILNEASSGKQILPEEKKQEFLSDATIRISVEKLNHLLNQAEEMLALNQSFAHINLKLKSIAEKVSTWEQEASGISTLVRDRQIAEAQGNFYQDENKINKQVASFFEWSVSSLKTIKDDIDSLYKFSQQENYNCETKTESLLEEVKGTISIPFSTILDGFPKVARDLSKDKGKRAVVDLTGCETEIDKRILEELKSPLMHLLRNSIDHGIEKPSDREKKNKPVAGTIRIAVERTENNRVIISFSDDGAGIDMEKVRQKYIKQEKIKEPDTAVDEKVLINYLFKSGVSTSEMITDLSGRGLGLSIVLEKIEELGGSVSVKTMKNKGTRFKIEVPLSLITFRGLNILVGTQELIVPTAKIDSVLRIEKGEIKTIGNKATVPYRGEVIRLVYLSEILGIPVKENENEHIVVLVLGTNGNYIGFTVDQLLDEEVILVKKFNDQLKRVPNITGATVLGSGKVVPVLNVSDLLKSAVKTAVPTTESQAPQKEKKKSSVLVVEDSITSRTLLRNILETAGYEVSTAIDGIDGYTQLKETPADLVVSDIDMPRLNGFDMTARIRADKALSEIPVVLVTSLSKREDRERGLEVGANAYIIKSNFDQGNLLEVIEHLIG